LTEDLRNPDVLYIGTETGIFLSLDRGQSWRRLRANLPTVRVDEITLHPRDNAMLVATHGRSLFVLDHLEPIQEFQSAQASAGDAFLFSVPSALQWKSKDDRNDEFWGHQFFVGENPPTDAVIRYHLKGAVDELSLRVSDAQGKTIREVTAPESRRQAGIRALCWDMRYEPIEAAQSAAATPEGGAAGGAPGGFGRGGGGAEIPGVPTPLSDPGYLPVNPCDLSGGEAGGGGFGGFGGGGNAGPYVTPGLYNVSLIVNGNTVDTKPMEIIKDPAIELSGVERVAYDEMLLGLHQLEGLGNQMATHLDALYAQVVEISGTIDDMEDVPDEMKADFSEYQEAFDELRVKFGVPIPAGGGGRRFGRRGGGDPANVLSQASALKNNIMSFWEAPSSALVTQFYDVTVLLDSAIQEAEESLDQARALADALEPYNVTLEVPGSGG
jgi:hypothetical protein